MTDYIRTSARGFSNVKINTLSRSSHFLLSFQLQVGSLNDGDSFDTDRLSGSMQYDEDEEQQDVRINDDFVDQTRGQSTSRNNDRKSQKKEVNTSR